MLLDAMHMTRALGRTAWGDLHRRYISQYLPSKPQTINFLVNDICNSRCQMCLIWKQKRDHELTPDELRHVLSDQLFARVSHIGMTGGEPTLRKDLADLFVVAGETLPRLRTASIITNAIRSEDVIERTTVSANECEARGIQFSMMVSLDGVGSTHDTVRGRAGNFESAVEVIRYFRDKTDIPLSVGCTVSKNNVWRVDEVLDFCRSENVYARFRVAEFIGRLYNADQTSIIKDFDEDESYHLAAFFKKLELTYETSHRVRRTYQSIQGMLMGGKRRVGCPYQSESVMLDCRGNLQYCAPKSHSIGNALAQSGAKLFKTNLTERRRVIKEDCFGCIHDYHATVTTPELLAEYNERFWRKVIRIDPTKRKPVPLFIKCLGIGNRSRKYKGDVRRVLITGWYGTETVGDKAILGGIMDEYESRYGTVEFTVSSLHPLVTHRTLKELGRAGSVLPVYSGKFLKACAAVDEVVMGGGPLMGLEVLAIPLWAFMVARQHGVKTTVCGCGMGPLESERHTNTVTRILNLADEVTLRDDASVRWREN